MEVRSGRWEVGRMKRFLKFKGRKGEEIAQRFLEKKGFKIVEKNYQRKNFEIDLIAQRRNEIHFVEVKTVFSLKTRPEEHFNFFKLKKIKKGILFYLKEKKIDLGKFKIQIDLLAIEVSLKLKKIKIRWYQNIC